MVAPDEDRSFEGRAKTIPSGMLRASEVKIAGAAMAYSIEGTSVDAVQFGLVALGVDRPFDAVVAGINQGSALGYEATSIGVVGAALEAAAHGLPAIAVSQDRRAHVFDVSANLTTQLLDLWLEKGLPEGIALSINVPGAAADRPRGVVVARLGQPELVVGGFHKVESSDPQAALAIAVGQGAPPRARDRSRLVSARRDHRDAAALGRQRLGRRTNPHRVGDQGPAPRFQRPSALAAFGAPSATPRRPGAT